MKLTANRNSFDLSVLIEESDIHIGREVSSFEARREIRVPNDGDINILSFLFLKLEKTNISRAFA